MTTEQEFSSVWLVGWLIAFLMVLCWAISDRDPDPQQTPVVCGTADKKLAIGPGDEIIWRYDKEKRCFDLAVRVK